MPSITRPFALTALLALSSLHAQAANVSFAGHIAYNTDVVQIAFSLDGAQSLTRLWTDSWQAGLNFDPTLILWVKEGSGYSLIGGNGMDHDDDNSVDPAQGFYDSGLSLPALAAGHYLLTLGASPNYASGTRLSDGFAFDAMTPTLVADWNQPSHDLNANDQKGSFWRVNLSGVNTASVVPEPATLALILAGLSTLLLARRRPQVS